VQGNTVTLTDNSTYKRTDLLIVPPGDYEHGAHPVNVQLKENQKETQQKNAEKEKLFREKHGPREPKEAKRQPPRIRMEPVVAPLLAIEDKPKPKAQPKAAMSALISQQKANYVPAKTRDQARQDRERREAEEKAAKKAEADRAARVRKEIADQMKQERARINKEVRKSLR
jgi:hypothetical protein